MLHGRGASGDSAKAFDCRTALRDFRFDGRHDRCACRGRRF